MGSMEQSRYKQNPTAVFFENYILGAIGQLPAEKAESIQSMNLQKVFKTQATEWRAVLREALDLSETIDIAILDLWFANQEIADAKGIWYSPEQFAMNFVDEYLKEGSKVDVWNPGSLNAARERVANQLRRRSQQ
jgi:predicted DNA-binding protein (UPF0278 family)